MVYFMFGLWCTDLGEASVKKDMKVLLKIIRVNGETLVNICEKDLLGMSFRENGVNLVVNSDFYGGEEVSIDYAFSYVNEATAVSLVGNSVVEEAIRRSLVDEDAVLIVQGVMFAQIYNIRE